MTNEKRLIDANKARVVAQRIYSDPVLVHVILNTLNETPTVDAVEVVHGRWVYNGRSDDYFCSNCFKQPISFRREMDCAVGEFVEVCFSDYCPNCGAKMDGGKDNG